MVSTPTVTRREPLAPALLTARNAVALSFALNGLVFASLVSRLPDLRERLELSNGGLGTLLLAISCGSLLALPSTGRVIERIGAGATVRAGVLADTVGLSTAAVGAVLGSVPLAALGLFVHGVGIGVWDVAMNVDAAEVERRMRRTVMPRFHAGWSAGSLSGAGLGVVVIALGTPLLAHLLLVALVVGVVPAASCPPSPTTPMREPREGRRPGGTHAPWRSG